MLSLYGCFILNHCVPHTILLLLFLHKCALLYYCVIVLLYCDSIGNQYYWTWTWWIFSFHQVHKYSIFVSSFFQAQDAFTITHIVVPKQTSTSDSCTALNEGEIFDVMDSRDLLTLGWIHVSRLKLWYHPSRPFDWCMIGVWVLSR